MKKMNTPNKLTILRMIMIPFFMVFQLNPVSWFPLAAFIVFVAASLTDTLDGYLARKNNQITNFGKLMDPLADKLLTFAAFLGFIQLGYISAWPVMIMIAREFLVTSVRLIALESGGKVIAANIWGKLKTITQMVSISVSLLLSAIPTTVHFVPTVTNILVWICAVLTLISGATYIIDNRKLFSDVG